MATNVPTLDSRALVDIMNELRQHARVSVPEWNPPIEGDAGTMLHRIFARLMELALQRLNRVPEKNQLAFLDAMGVTLLPPAPARVPLTFSLTAGTPPTLVPQGTQVISPGKGQQPAINFETEHDLTVLPAQLVSAFTMDPTWDRSSDHTLAVGGDRPVAFMPFVGTKQVPHFLHLVDEAVLNIGRFVELSVGFDWSSIGGSIAGDVQEFLRQLSYEYGVGAMSTNIGPPNRVDVTSDHASVVFAVPFPNQLEPAKDAELTAGRWLNIRLDSPMPDLPVSHDLRISGLTLRARSSQSILPDQAFVNKRALDVTKEFSPLGERPGPGDAFYLASEEAFGKTGATIKLSLEPGPPIFSWEYLGFSSDVSSAWYPVPSVQGSLLDGFVQLDNLDALILDTLNDSKAMRWFKVRVVRGSPGIVQFTNFRFLDARLNQRAPDAGFANDQKIPDFSKSFLPFGIHINPGAEFFFGSIEVPQRSVILGVSKVEILPRANVGVEYLSYDGWKPVTVIDTTGHLTKSGTMVFTCPLIPQLEINNTSNRWIRIRLISGDYGRDAEFVPAKTGDPSKGFKIVQGTGSFAAPLLNKFVIDYDVTKRPEGISRRTGFVTELLSTDGSEFSPFVSIKDLTSAPADPEPAFYLGFDAAFPEQPVSLYVDVARRAFAGGPVKERIANLPSTPLPQVQWQYFNGTAWKALPVVDDTNNLTESGSLQFLTPPDIQPLAKFDSGSRYWVRALSAKNDPFDTQQLGAVFLNTVLGAQRDTVLRETVGSSNSQPNQKLRLARTPILPGNQLILKEPEYPSDQERAGIELEEGENAIQSRHNEATQNTETWVRWHEVPNFLASAPQSRHYTLDRINGSVSFGDGKHGLIPPAGSNNIVATYQAGGGSNGNLPKGAVAQIKSSLPGVAAVTNPIATDGGSEVETIEMVKQRGPQVIKHRNHAVTPADLEWLALQAAGTRVARAKCLPNVNRDLQFEPGWVTLLIVPRDLDTRLSPSSELIRQVENYLAERAFVGLTHETPMRVNVIGAGYVPVAVNAEVVAKKIDEAQPVKQRVLAALAAFFHPLTGGRFGSGWEFGRDVYASEVSQLIESVRGVDHVAPKMRLVANVAQRRLSISALTTSFDLPEGMSLMTKNGPQGALLAERIAAGSVNELAVTGFKQGDRITKVLDLKYKSTSDFTIHVEAFNSDATSFPVGSVVRSFDGSITMRLATAIPAKQQNQTTIIVDSKVEGLRPGDRLTVFYPFPMTITSVVKGELSRFGPTPSLLIGIEPYEPQYPINSPSIFSTLDNTVRLPLVFKLPAGTEVTSLGLVDFYPGEQLTFIDRNGKEALSATITKTETIEDVVHLSENFLVYSGAHHITMLQE